MQVTTEVQLNTRCVLLTVLDGNVDVKLRLDAVRGTAWVHCYRLGDSVGHWGCAMPKDIDWKGVVTMEKGKDCVVVRLPLMAIGPTQSVLLLGRSRENGPLAEGLPRVQQVNNRLECRSCHAALIEAGSFDRVLRLPSSLWMELAELWGCHTESFAAAPNKDLVVAPRAFYFGDAHAVVHPSHLVAGATKVDGGGGGRIACTQCEASVGMKNTARGGGIIIFMDALSDGRPFFEQWSLERRLAWQLFDLSQGSGVWRFHCVTENLYVVLVNWDTEVAVKEHVVPASVLKVRFWTTQVPLEDDGAGPWTELDWTETEGRHLLACLKQHADKYLAPSLSIMGQQHISFLWM